MVTPHQLLKVVNSLAYRRKLEEGMSNLESTVLEYMRENETNKVRIGGYQVLRENGQITVYELPPVDTDQLKLRLYTHKKNNHREFNSLDIS